MLDDEWKKWVNINLSNRCSLVDIYHGMLQAGLVQDTALIGLNKELAKVRYRPYHYMKHTANTVTLEENSRELKIPIAFRCSSPEIVIFNNFLSDEECDGLIEIAKDRMTDSKVISHLDGSDVYHEHRTSRNGYFKRGETELLKRIEERISRLLRVPVENGEGMQVLNYGVGKQYKPHYDFFDSKTGSAKHIQNGGQRMGTFLMYLNDVEEGGTTSFPELDITVYPQKGSALFFSYTNDQYQCDDRSLHAGDPVIKGSKWLATKWLREREFIEPHKSPAKPHNEQTMNVSNAQVSNQVLNSQAMSQAVNNTENKMPLGTANPMLSGPRYVLETTASHDIIHQIVNGVTTKKEGNVSYNLKNAVQPVQAANASSPKNKSSNRRKKK